MSEWKPRCGLISERVSVRILRVWYLAGAFAGGWRALEGGEPWLFVLIAAAFGVVVAAIVAAAIDCAVDFCCDGQLFNDVFVRYPKTKAEEDVQRELHYLDYHF